MDFEEMDYFPEEENARWDYVKNVVSWLRVAINAKDEELKNVKNELWNVNKRVDEHDWLMSERVRQASQNELQGETEHLESVDVVQKERKFAAINFKDRVAPDSGLDANKMGKSKDSIITEDGSLPSSFIRNSDIIEMDDHSTNNFNSESAAEADHSLATDSSGDDRVFRLVAHYTGQMDNLLARIEHQQFEFDEALMRQELVVLDIVQHFEERLTTAENDVHSLTFQLQSLDDSLLSKREELVRMSHARNNDLREFFEDQLNTANAHCDVTRTMAAKTASDLSRVNDALHWHEECCREMLKTLEKGVTRSEHRITSRMAMVSDKVTKLEKNVDSFLSDRRSLEARVTSRVERHLGEGVARLVERSMEEERAETANWLDEQLMDRLHQHSPLVWMTLVKRDWDDAYFELQATLRSEMRLGENRLVGKMEAGLGDVMAVLVNQKVAMEEMDGRSACARIKMVTRVEGLDDAVKAVFRKLEIEMESFRNEKDELIDEYYRVVDVVNGMRMDCRFEEVGLRVDRVRDTVNSIGDRVKNYHAKLMVLDDSVDARVRAVDRKLKVVEDTCKKLAEDHASLKSEEMNQLQVRFETIHLGTYVLENKLDNLSDVIRTVEDNCVVARQEEAETVKDKMTKLDERIAAFINRMQVVENFIKENERTPDKCAATRMKLKSLQKTMDFLDKKIECRFQTFESKLTAISPKEKQKVKHKK